jgi:hypothetical protein
LNVRVAWKTLLSTIKTAIAAIAAAPALVAIAAAPAKPNRVAALSTTILKIRTLGMDPT